MPPPNPKSPIEVSADKQGIIKYSYTKLAKGYTNPIHPLTRCLLGVGAELLAFENAYPIRMPMLAVI